METPEDEEEQFRSRRRYRNDDAFITVTLEFRYPNFREHDSLEAVATDIHAELVRVLCHEVGDGQRPYPYLNSTKAGEERSIAYTPQVTTRFGRRGGTMEYP